MSLVFLSILFCIIQIYGEPHSLNGTVYYEPTSNKYEISLNVMDPTGACYGYFNDTLNVTGWSILDIKTGTQKNINDTIKMYSCGYLEGYLSSYEIDTYYHATIENSRAMLDVFGRDFHSWYNVKTSWINSQIAANKNDKTWIFMNLLQNQVNGLYNGYNTAARQFNLKTLTLFDFDFLNAMEDYGDVAAKLVFDNITDPLKQKQYKTLKKDEYKYGAHVHSHCSGLVKVTPTFDDLYFSHDTWTDYWTMNRIFKHYNFILDANYPTQKMSFSSYPSVLNSIDDYYIMDSGIASMETTNFQLNPELWKYCNAQQLWTWQRVRIANAMASNGQEWIEYFTPYNSGTYNNQWIILDYKLFEIGQPLKDGLLMIAEQLPGTVKSMDVTNILERGYWASYNVPAIPYIYELSGNKAYAEIHGVQDSYDLAPRARIFRKYINKYNNLTQVENFMRYNNYKYDPIENDNPTWAIMNRRDLMNGDGAIPFGGTDTKLANLEMLQKTTAIVKAGPTNKQQPTFTWNSKWNGTFHRGLPETYDFDWTVMTSIL